MTSAASLRSIDLDSSGSFPKLAGDRLAVIDIGSNSVRMMIFDCAQTPPKSITDFKNFCALGRDLGRTGRLYEDGVTDALQTLSDYKQAVDTYRITTLVVVGTAALREAADAPDFINRVKQDLGISIRVLSGHEEAYYAALGVLSLDPAADGVVADYGGGSLELARVFSKTVHQTVSLPLGSLRILSQPEPIDGYIARHLEEVDPVFCGIDSIYVIGGSWRSLAQSHLRYEGQATPRALQGYRVEAKDMVAFCRMVRDMTPADIMNRFGLDDRRADLMPVSAALLGDLVNRLAARDVVVSTAGLRDGVVHRLTHPPVLKL